MIANPTRFTLALLAGAALLTACGQQAPSAADTSPTSAPPENVTIKIDIPASLAPFGDGYPKAGDPCRRLGESAATANWLDDGAVLVGCPTAESAAAVGGTVVAKVEGVRVISIPMGDANQGMATPAATGDALVAGTDYNATASIKCSFDGSMPSGSCPVGVKRNWGEAGSHLVEVSKPDGRKRAIFFKGTTPTGADSAQSDGSAAWKFAFERRGDEVLIRFGPERYVIVDALLTGG
ncbi:hypothetical protein [Sandarakinorhabdus rubra]|uniref:hypothetical protein n=1 Tax=Sandarakinorhabdus rubra TaxID=2672568 RepID=UPI001F32C898|nr:hypothetical protein [Sandarakinorhabdus rubra]